MPQRISTGFLFRRVAVIIIGVAISMTVLAEGVLEEIIVTAQKREQNVQDVPISITTLSADRLDSKFSGGESILALAGSAPGLYAESSNGRHSPRFYLRGLGNADFDQAASQPVSVVFDEVAMEQVVLKAFPVFDIDHVEVIRGPQSTLYGRNTTAGIIKLDSRRPTEETEGFVKLSGGNKGTFNAEAALGGTLIKDKLTGRVSFLAQNRSNWINNDFNGVDIGGYDDFAGRVQLLWTPTDNLSVLLLHQRRDLGGRSASAFRANILTAGSNKLNGNFDRNTVYFDGGGGNHASIRANGTNLKVDWEVGDYTLTSITSFQNATQFARGDIDGGVVDPTMTLTVPPGITSATPPFTIPAFGPALTFPGNIFISSDTGGNNVVEQLTQEVRIASNLDGPFNYQVGGFYFSDELTTSTEFGTGPGAKDLFVAAIAFHENDSWAVYGQGDYDINDQLTLTAGVRYSEDVKDYTPILAPPTQAPIHLTDTDVSWNVSLAYAINDYSRVYTRIATGFRAPSIQARNAAFGGAVTTATSETIMSYEVGYKAEINDRIRLDIAGFYYDIDDMQLTAIGGAGNFTTLLNAQGGTGYGVEFDIEYAVTDNLILSGGFGYNKTEINDDTLSIAPCNQCTITDQLDANGNAIIDGNPFQHAPKWTLNAELSYTYPLANNKELYFFTDWKAKGKTNEFLYKSIEFEFDTQFEGGLRAGYRDNTRHFEIGLFARNVTDEENPIGGIDFTNNTSYVNEPRIWGVEASYHY